MSRRSTSPTLAKARARATRDGWDPALVRSEVDARAVLEAGCYFDEDAAARVVKFFEKVLRHADTSTSTIGPFQLLDWQRDEFLRPLFGWKRREETRRYRRGGVWVPKKNGKSTLAAGLELYLLTADDELGAEVYSAANDRQQAGIIHGHAVRMVELSPILAKRIGTKGIIRSTKTIYDQQSGSVFRALSADVPTKEGLNIHGLIVDEIHAMQKRQMLETLWYGGASRRQPLALSISTAGIYDVGSIGWEQYSYARDIVQGTKDDDWSFFALIYEARPDEDWTAEATWRKANPSYGKTVNVASLAEECTEAQAEPRKQNAFRRYRLNQWVQQATRWIPLETWKANHRHPVSRAALKGRECWGGLDLASVGDLTAYALLFECPHDPEALDVLVRLWVPEDALKDPYNRNASLYQVWSDTEIEGIPILETTPGNSTDYDFIEAAILRDAQEFKIQSIGIDRLFQGQQVANHLNQECGNEFVIAIGQGFLGQGAPMKEFERRWRKLCIHHGDHPALRWMADNVEVKQDPAGNLKIVKPNSKNDPRKVDGIQAIVNAIDGVSRAIHTPPPDYSLHFIGGR